MTQSLKSKQSESGLLATVVRKLFTIVSKTALMPESLEKTIKEKLDSLISKNKTIKKLIDVFKLSPDD
jgi:hypothetical protein